MQGRNLLLAAWALSCCTWLASGPALAQVLAQAATETERVPIILSKLPPQSSPNYKTMRKRAGENTTVEVLSLTSTEVWSVPPARIDALKAAAARLGVGVTGLAADWNHLFRPMPMGMATKGAHEAMLGQTGSSMATMGVGMMLPPRAAMVEYALTRGADAQPPTREPAKVVLRLNDTTALTIVRTSVIVKPDMCIWRGTVEGTGAPATIMWWPGVTMAGTVRHDGRIYSIRRVRGGVNAIAVVEMSEERMPPEHAPMPQRLRDDPSLRDDPLVRDGDASALRRLLRALAPSRPNRAEARPESKRDAKASTPVRVPAKPGESAGIVIRAMVAYTKKAAQKYADIRRELIELAVEETNQSFRNSNLGHIRLELVHSYQTDYVEEGEHFDHLWRFADKDDGYMEEVHGRRVIDDADVAILIVDDAKGCGLATRVFADAEDAFAVVHHECAATSYSLAHEIGHLIGARHELEVDKTMTPFPYGHGYVNGTKWRDIMSYKASCGGCRRLPVWSSPKLVIEGERAGSANEDNARVIAEQAARIASFRPSRQRRAYGAGPAALGKPADSTADQPVSPK